jgi:hypothetical protein
MPCRKIRSVAFAAPDRHRAGTIYTPVEKLTAGTAIAFNKAGHESC